MAKNGQLFQVSVANAAIVLWGPRGIPWRYHRDAEAHAWGQSVQVASDSDHRWFGG